jgi:hypothetical protein
MNGQAMRLFAIAESQWLNKFWAIVRCTISLDFRCAMHNKQPAEALRGYLLEGFGPQWRTHMNQQLEVVQKLGKDSFDATVKAFEVASAGANAIVVETTDYAKKSFQRSAATFEKLASVKSLDKAIEVQTDFVKSAYEGFVAQSAKTRELYTKLAQDSFAPFGALYSAAQPTFTPAKPAPRAK